MELFKTRDHQIPGWMQNRQQWKCFSAVMKSVYPQKKKCKEKINECLVSKRMNHRL